MTKCCRLFAAERLFWTNRSVRRQGASFRASSRFLFVRPALLSRGSHLRPRLIRNLPSAFTTTRPSLSGILATVFAGRPGLRLPQGIEPFAPSSVIKLFALSRTVESASSNVLRWSSHRLACIQSLPNSRRPQMQFPHRPSCFLAIYRLRKPIYFDRLIDSHRPAQESIALACRFTRFTLSPNLVTTIGAGSRPIRPI